jgi:hypothetical protein
MPAVGPYSLEFSLKGMEVGRGKHLRAGQLVLSGQRLGMNSIATYTINITGFWGPLTQIGP